MQRYLDLILETLGVFLGDRVCPKFWDAPFKVQLIGAYLIRWYNKEMVQARHNKECSYEYNVKR